MKRAIVTGAAGFAGWNLVQVLIQAGYFVYAVVRPCSVHNTRLCSTDYLAVIELDMQDLLQLPSLIDVDCDVFFHLAWQGARNDFADQYQNVNFSLAALDAAARLHCLRFVCTGSQAEYGRQSKVMVETILPNPENAYGASKVATCYLTRCRAEQLEIDWIWGRIFSLYGRYEPDGRLLPDLVHALQCGDSFNLTAATQNWDYLYAMDAGEALLALAERGRSGEIYNIANGDYRTLREFVEELRTYFAPEASLHYGQDSRQGIALQPSVAKIYQDTGWKPKTDFIDGIRQVYG